MLQVVLFLAGLAAGAAGSIIARSLPSTGRLVARPACPRCGRPTGWLAASVVLSRISGVRPCRACGARACAGDLWIELACGLVFALVGLRGPLDLAATIQLGFALLLVVILAIDLRHREVYLVLGYGGIGASLLLSPLSLPGGLASATAGVVVGAALFGLLYLLGRVLYRGHEPLGTGDVTIAALLGGMVGFPGVLTALVLGILAGGVGAMGLLALRRERRAYMPYGPALCIGGLATLLLGDAGAAWLLFPGP